MVRRSFRMGLRLGLLFGVGFALFKTMQSKRTTPAGGPVVEPGAWEPLTPDAAEQPRSSVADPRPSTPSPATAEPSTPPRTSTGAGSSPANVRPSSPPRPAAATPPPPSLRMPEVPPRPAAADATPPSAASEGRAATSTPATPRPPVVDEVGEPILEPAAPVEPAPSPRRSRTRSTRAAAKDSPSAGAAEGTPPEEQLLNAGVVPASDPDADPDLDVIPSDDIVPPRPVRKATAKKAAPAKKAAKAAKKAAAAPGWVEATEGICPPTHPVKAKLASRLFHLPGMFAYARTRPDRCYLDAETAVTDGFTAAKR